MRIARPHASLHRAQVTLAHGRKYGLVGRNGIGKTTFLKFLAAARFDGVPPNMQILHIEQEVAGGTASVLEMVLATSNPEPIPDSHPHTEPAPHQVLATSNPEPTPDSHPHTEPTPRQVLATDVERSALLAEEAELLSEQEEEEAEVRVRVRVGVGVRVGSCSRSRRRRRPRWPSPPP